MKGRFVKAECTDVCMQPHHTIVVVEKDVEPPRPILYGPSGEVIFYWVSDRKESLGFKMRSNDGS